MKRALITGVNGQDGSYLADILHVRGYEVHGLVRKSSSGRLDNVKHLLGKIHIHNGDVTDYQSVCDALYNSSPHYVFHEADQDNVDWSFKTPSYTIDVTVKGASNVLEAVRGCDPGDTRVFMPCSAMMFGDAPPPQSESTPFNPLSPYACGKVAVYHLSQYYRQVHKMWVSTGILYNHDSPRRNGPYLLHRIVKAAVAIEKGLSNDPFHIYGMDDVISIGVAREYMVGVVDLMELDEPDNYVIGTSWHTTLRRLVADVFDECGLDYRKHVIETTTPHRIGGKHSLIPNNDKAKNHFKFCASGVNELIPAIADKYRKELSCG